MLNDLRIREYTEVELRNLNPLQLALIGDGVYEVFIRNHVLDSNKELSPHKMHIRAIQFVKAKSQATIIHTIEEELTEEETYIYKRGRNCKSGTVPKNADVRDYREASGFEALVGYLYLLGNIERLKFVFQKAVEIIK